MKQNNRKDYLMENCMNKLCDVVGDNVDSMKVSFKSGNDDLYGLVSMGENVISWFTKDQKIIDYFTLHVEHKRMVVSTLCWDIDGFGITIVKLNSRKLFDLIYDCFVDEE